MENYRIKKHSSYYSIQRLDKGYWVEDGHSSPSKQNCEEELKAMLKDIKESLAP